MTDQQDSSNHPGRTTDTPAVDDELIAHLCRHSVLTATEAERVVGEVLAYFGENLNDYVRRRHLELQAQGISNAVSFSMIGKELNARRFCANALSTRQIRRIIYG
jgi:hypothetical protein